MAAAQNGTTPPPQESNGSHGPSDSANEHSSTIQTILAALCQDDKLMEEGVPVYAELLRDNSISQLGAKEYTALAMPLMLSDAKTLSLLVTEYSILANLSRAMKEPALDPARLNTLLSVVDRIIKKVPECLELLITSDMIDTLKATRNHVQPEPARHARDTIQHLKLMLADNTDPALGPLREALNERIKRNHAETENGLHLPLDATSMDLTTQNNSTAKHSSNQPIHPLLLGAVEMTESDGMPPAKRLLTPESLASDDMIALPKVSSEHGWQQDVTVTASTAMSGTALDASSEVSTPSSGASSLDTSSLGKNISKKTGKPKKTVSWGSQDDVTTFHKHLPVRWDGKTELPPADENAGQFNENGSDIGASTVPWRLVAIKFSGEKGAAPPPLVRHARAHQSTHPTRSQQQESQRQQTESVALYLSDADLPPNPTAPSPDQASVLTPESALLRIPFTRSGPHQHGAKTGQHAQPQPGARGASNAPNHHFAPSHPGGSLHDSGSYGSQQTHQAPYSSAGLGPGRPQQQAGYDVRPSPTFQQPAPSDQSSQIMGLLQNIQQQVSAQQNATQPDQQQLQQQIQMVQAQLQHALQPRAPQPTPSAYAQPPSHMQALPPQRHPGYAPPQAWAPLNHYSYPPAYAAPPPSANPYRPTYAQPPPQHPPHYAAQPPPQYAPPRPVYRAEPPPLVSPHELVPTIVDLTRVHTIEDRSSLVCKYWRQDKRCKFGAKCRFLHPIDLSKF